MAKKEISIFFFLSGFVKLLIHLVRGILHWSGKSQGKVRERNFNNLWLWQPWLKSHQTSIHLKKALNTFRSLVSSALLRDSVIRGFEDEDYCDHRTKKRKGQKLQFVTLELGSIESTSFLVLRRVLADS